MTKILLVEDRKFLRLATERALARAGYQVWTAVDGDSALQAAREKRPDVILLDMLLPGMSGPDVLKALKKDPATAEIAVVVLTELSHKNAERSMTEPLLFWRNRNWGWTRAARRCWWCCGTSCGACSWRFRRRL
jgi:CheY-like chemotaxis protein